MQDLGSAQRVSFSGSRLYLGLLLLRGYLLMIPTIGLNRFWLNTRKRRFYWSNTEIDGDTLEYTGDAGQLLTGFLMALVVFVPVYGLFFYLSTQSSEVIIIGYGAVALAVWFLHGYATYRARDFRLSRTLWRGIRFDQTGNAWNYALRRFAWSLLNVVTLGLAYPFMAANLWSYRYRHTWFGDRPFAFAGSWRQLLLPYYPAWLVAAGLALTGLVMASESGLLDDPFGVDVSVYLWLGMLALGILVVSSFYRALETSCFFSAVTLGDARLSMRLSPWRLIGQYCLFAVALVVVYVLLALGGLLVMGVVAAPAFAGGEFDFGLLLRAMQSSVVTLLAVITGYLLIFGAFVFVSELILGYGFWRLVVTSAEISGISSLDTVRARAEDKALAGEGLADALNVGGY